MYKLDVIYCKRQQALINDDVFAINPQKKSGIQLGFKPRTPAHQSDALMTRPLGPLAEEWKTSLHKQHCLSRTSTDQNQNVLGLNPAGSRNFSVDLFLALSAKTSATFFTRLQEVQEGHGTRRLFQSHFKLSLCKFEPQQVADMLLCWPEMSKDILPEPCTTRAKEIGHTLQESFLYRLMVKWKNCWKNIGTYVVYNPQSLQREEGPGHAATINLSLWQKPAVTNEIRALLGLHALSWRSNYITCLADANI